MTWSSEVQSKYHQFAKNYISSYNEKIDCADLAIAALIEFAAKESLPVRFKYYSGGWKWINFVPSKDDKNEFKLRAMRMLGALNVIDNTSKVTVSAAKPGDFIMSKWSGSLGHTRVIYSVTPEKSKYKVVWYQGNLPPVKPEKKEDYFSNIQGVFEQQPRRWSFEQFGE
ncbi:hypothetical protein CWC05_10450 [Pseudoalteromonas ruthenica]|uniref:Uncharacterized protein n=1 Tax=Pseudoalteromonas ruthenica TaxID=151081 RepID=A0A5S3Z3P2_9GAMM|nr:hypothetical protein [Pseudoalteromonas ruthenica]TMP86889.1 hypothetical protein CWC05_10450 [Pseudoalteromonas ruthenica]